MITVRYFARLKEVTGVEQESLPITSTTVQELMNWAAAKYGGFASDSRSLHVAVNEEYVQPHDKIVSGDVVAFIPPVSGG